jgi:hypothetical protein
MGTGSIKRGNCLCARRYTVLDFVVLQPWNRRQLVAIIARRATPPTVGKREAQVPPDRKQDDFRFELAPFEQTGD